MTEMGYTVNELYFYEISTNKIFPINLPGEKERKELERFISAFYEFNPSLSAFHINSNKCRHCIYCNLCDKTELDNVYT